MKRLLLLPLLFVFAVISAAAASLSPSDRDIYETAVNLQNYPNASVAVLLDKTKMNISHDRSYVKTRRVVKRILNYKGKKEHAEFKIVFDDRYEAVTVDFAVTVNGGDGGYKVTPVEDSAVKIIDAPFDTGNMHYAVHKMMIVAFPAVEEGSVVDIVYTIKNNMKKDFSYKTVFADPEAVCKKIFTVIYPSDMFLNAGLSRHKGDVDERRAADSILVNGRKSITWSAVELPQALRESNAPYRSYLFTSGYISTYRDWDSFRAELAAMFYEKAVASEELKQITETVIAGAGDDRDRIVRVRDYIARNVAVKNINGLTSYELRTPESIQKSGYAGSFDRTLLMCVMLDLAGLKAEPVIVGPSELFWKDYEDRVYTDSFYHVLTRTGCDGEEYYVDGADEFETLGATGYENSKAFSLSEDGEVFTIRPESKNGYMVTYDYSITIGKEGDALIDVSKTYTGSAARGVKRKYKYMTPKEREQDYEKEINGISENAEPVTKIMEVILDDTVTVKYSYLHRRFASVDGDFMYFTIPVSLVPFNPSENPESRIYPYVMFSDSTYRNNCIVRFPKNMKVLMLPDDVSVSGGIFSDARKIDVEGNIIRIDDVITMQHGIVEKDGYAGMYQLITALADPKHDTFLFKKTRKFLGLF